jgi:tight adherence protein B
VNPLTLMLLTFLAVVFVILAVYATLSDLFLRDRARFSRRIDDEFRTRLREQARKSALFKDLSALATEPVEKEDILGPRRRFQAVVEQSGLALTAERLLAIMIGTGAVLGTVAFLLQGILAGTVGALLGVALPWLYVSLKRKWRLDKLMSQLPDTFELMGRVIRAGQTIPQAMQAVVDEFDVPVSAEFSYCYEQQNLGLPVEIAYRDLCRRTGLLEIKIFVLAMLIQQQSGGNLAELLDNLAHVVRERFRVRGKVKTLTAEGRLQAAVLLAMPPVMLAIIMFLNPRYAQVLLDHPNLVIGMLVAEGLGALWIRRIVNFDF